MATATKVVPMRKPGEALPPELRDFLDTVIVPALLRQFLSECEGMEAKPQKTLARGKTRSHTPGEASAWGKE